MSGSVVGNLKIRLDFDSSQFERGMAQARRELSTYDRAVGMSTRIAKDNNYAMKDSSHALHNMRVAYRGNKEMVDKLAAANVKLKKDGDQTGKLEKNANAMRNYEMKMYDLNKEYEKMQKQMYTANSMFTKSGKVMESVGGVVKTAGDGISQVGAGLTKAGVALTGTMGVFVKQAVDFEQGLAGVQKTTNASNEEMEVLEGNIRDMAKEMPIATGELLKLGEQAGQLGIAQSDIAEFTEVMVMMGTATNLSAEEAGESFARFVNITGHGMDGLDKLGSAVVHLGNNFATTESEIMNLAMGLAGSLSTVGVAEADILGLSAGMSALGINAERGSSSMSKMFIEMAKDVQTGTGNLEQFAQVSGVTVKEFQQAFEEDAMGAMEMFITGLGQMDEAGGDMLGTLEKMGINEIRLRDTILRLAGGHEVLSDAIKTSNEGYAEGSALQEEYDILAQTTASQIEIAKNKMKDMSLTMGQALLPAFIDLIDNSDGLIKSIEKGVDWFVNLDDTVKQNIVQFTAFALVGGPILSMFGNITSGIGGLLIAGGKMSKGVGKISGLLQTKAARALGDTVTNIGGTTSAMESLADGAATASGPKGVGLLVKALAGSAGLPWALGIAGVAIAGWAGWKLWGEGIYKANRQTQEWGTTLSDEAETTLTGIKSNVEEVAGQFGAMARGLDTDTASMVGNMQDIGQTIEDDLNNRLELTNEYISGLPEHLRQSQEEIINDHKQHLERTLGLVDENSGRIAEIEQNALNEKRENTATELAVIRELQNESLSEYIGTLGLSIEEEKSMRQVLSGDVQELTEKQAVNTLMTFKRQNDDIAEAQKQSTEELNEYMVAQGIRPESAVGKELLANNERYWDALSVSSERSMDEIVKMYPGIVNDFNLLTGEMIDESMSGYKQIVAVNKAIVGDLTESHKDMEAQAREAREATKNVLDVSTHGAKAWNQVVATTGETVEEFRNGIRDATEDVDTWNELRPVIHNADLDSNAKKIIAEALIENGRWEELTWGEEQALLEDSFSLTVYRAMKQEGEWNDLEWEEQKAVLLSNTPEQVQQALEDIGIWDKIDPTIQDLIVDNKGATEPTKEAQKELGDYNKITTPIKYPKVDASGAIRPATEAEIALGDYNKTNVPEKYINATDNASSKAKTARTNLLNIPGLVTTTIRTIRETIFGNEKGTNFHPGGLAMVNDERSNRFRELVTLPGGQQFIPEGKNVMLDLPRGSKVLRASLTKRKFPDLPQYADGVGLQTTRVPKSFNEQRPAQSNNVGNLQSQINQLTRIIASQQQQAQTEGVTINIDTIENYTEHDIPKILEEASWIMLGEERRLYGKQNKFYV